MTKALNTFIILNLVVGAALAFFAITLFLKMDLIKGRTLILRESLTTLSSQLKWGEVVADFPVEDKQNQTFTLSKPNHHEDLAAFRQRLDGLSSFATGRVGQLGGTHTILVSTRNTLEDTRNELAIRERELAEAREDIAGLESDIQDTQNELARVRTDIATRQGEISGLQTLLDTLNNDLVNRSNTLDTLGVDLETAIEERDVALQRYKICKIGTISEGGSNAGEWRGKTASILTVNDTWNYVVIDKGIADKLKPEIYAYVHRGNQYVGKLEVTTIKNGVSVAKIVPNSVATGLKIEKGDKIFF